MTSEFTGWRKASYSQANGGCIEVGWRRSSYNDANPSCVEVRTWRKSTYSGQNGGCVEVGGWRKSTYSDTNGGCVEVGTGHTVVGVRDTQQYGVGPVLEFPATAWRAFLATVSADRAA